MELRFVKSESTFSYFDALESYLLEHGRPVAFYSDKHTVFRVPKPNEHMTGMTQFGRALSELNIEIICANSSQANGRVERANRTLQDRLVKELRIVGISNIEDENAFLAGFVERNNAKFAKAPAKPDNLHRALNIEPDRLAEIFRRRDKCYVTKDLTLKYDRKRIRLKVNDLTRGLVGKYVGYSCDARWAHPSPCQRRRPALQHLRSTPTAGYPCRYHREQTPERRPRSHQGRTSKGSSPPKVKLVSAKNGYKKTGRRPPGRPSKMEAHYERRRAERARAEKPT